MFIYQLLKEYKKYFGIRKTFIRNFKLNKWIAAYLLFSLLFPGLLIYFYFKKNEIFMIASLIVYFIILYLGGNQHIKLLLKNKPDGTISYKVGPFLEILKNKFHITSDEQLKILDEVVKRQITFVEHSRKYPLIDIIRQMIVAIPVTGLLSYSFFELRDGNSERATPLLAVYILCIGIVLITSGFLQQFKDFTTHSHLNNISILIQLALLERSIRVKNNPSRVSEDVILQKNKLPPRKQRESRSLNYKQ